MKYSQCYSSSNANTRFRGPFDSLINGQIKDKKAISHCAAQLPVGIAEMSKQKENWAEDCELGHIVNKAVEFKRNLKLLCLWGFFSL